MAKKSTKVKKTKLEIAAKVVNRSLWQSMRRRLEIVDGLTRALAESKEQDEKDKKELLLAAPKEIRTFLTDKEILHYLFLNGTYIASLYKGRAGFANRRTLAKKLQIAWASSIEVTVSHVDKSETAFLFQMV